MPSAANAALTLVYDARNRLARVDGSAGTIQANHYNGRGERVRKVAGSNTALFTYDEAGRLLGEFDAGGVARQMFVWMDDMPVAVVEGATLRYIETDHLNTPRALIDPARNVAVWRWDLQGSAFGEHAANEDPDADAVLVKFNLRFPGQYLDAETGLHYNYFRDYEAATGRYVESDPIGLAGGISTYGYALQNPVVIMDPTGLAAWYCRRPLCPAGTNCTTGDRGPPLVSHSYLCVTRRDGSIECGGQTSDDPFAPTSPGRPTRPDEDSYHPDSCNMVDGDDDRCIEACLLDNFNKPRPPYALAGPQGSNCHEWADDRLRGCQMHCVRPANARRFRDR